MAINSTLVLYCIRSCDVDILNHRYCTVEPVCSGHLGTSLKYQGVLIFQVSLHVNGYFETINSKCLDSGGVPIFKGPD